MKASPPLTPFSTPLSGSAKEAELRLRNLFSSPKRRPPVWVLALLAVISLSCGDWCPVRALTLPLLIRRSLSPSPPVTRWPRGWPIPARTPTAPS